MAKPTAWDQINRGIQSGLQSASMFKQLGVMFDDDKKLQDLISKNPQMATYIRDNPDEFEPIWGKTKTYQSIKSQGPTAGKRLKNIIDTKSITELENNPVSMGEAIAKNTGTQTQAEREQEGIKKTLGQQAIEQGKVNLDLSKNNVTKQNQDIKNEQETIEKRKKVATWLSQNSGNPNVSLLDKVNSVNDLGMRSLLLDDNINPGLSKAYFKELQEKWRREDKILSAQLQASNNENQRELLNKQIESNKKQQNAFAFMQSVGLSDPILAERMLYDPDTKDRAEQLSNGTIKPENDTDRALLAAHQTIQDVMKDKLSKRKMEILDGPLKNLGTSINTFLTKVNDKKKPLNPQEQMNSLQSIAIALSPLNELTGKDIKIVPNVKKGLFGGSSIDGFKFMDGKNEISPDQIIQHILGQKFNSSNTNIKKTKKELFDEIGKTNPTWSDGRVQTEVERRFNSQ